jgi:hypothetical protein
MVHRAVASFLAKRKCSGWSNSTRPALWRWPKLLLNNNSKRDKREYVFKKLLFTVWNSLLNLEGQFHLNLTSILVCATKHFGFPIQKVASLVKTALKTNSQPWIETSTIVRRNHPYHHNKHRRSTMATSISNTMSRKRPLPKYYSDVEAASQHLNDSATSISSSLLSESEHHVFLSPDDEDGRGTLIISSSDCTDTSSRAPIRLATPSPSFAFSTTSNSSPRVSVKRTIHVIKFIIFPFLSLLLTILQLESFQQQGIYVMDLQNKSQQPRRWPHTTAVPPRSLSTNPSSTVANNWYRFVPATSVHTPKKVPTVATKFLQVFQQQLEIEKELQAQGKQRVLKSSTWMTQDYRRQNHHHPNPFSRSANSEGRLRQQSRQVPKSKSHTLSSSSNSFKQMSLHEDSAPPMHEHEHEEVFYGPQLPLADDTKMMNTAHPQLIVSPTTDTDDDDHHTMTITKVAPNNVEDPTPNEQAPMMEEEEVSMTTGPQLPDEMLLDETTQ